MAVKAMSPPQPPSKVRRPIIAVIPLVLLPADSVVPRAVDVGDRSARRDLAALKRGERRLAPVRLPHRGEQQDAGLVQHSVGLARAELARGEAGQAIEHRNVALGVNQGLRVALAAARVICRASERPAVDVTGPAFS